LLSPEVVGRQIGRSGETVRSWIRDGILAAIRLPNGLFKVRKSQVNAILSASAIDKQVK
jgi:predicted site-specific integrase-resolvase